MDALGSVLRFFARTLDAGRYLFIIVTGLLPPSLRRLREQADRESRASGQDAEHHPPEKHDPPKPDGPA